MELLERIHNESSLARQPPLLCAPLALVKALVGALGRQVQALFRGFANVLGHVPCLLKKPEGAVVADADTVVTVLKEYRCC